MFPGLGRSPWRENRDTESRQLLGDVPLVSCRKLLARAKTAPGQFACFYLNTSWSGDTSSAQSLLVQDQEDQEDQQDQEVQEDQQDQQDQEDQQHQEDQDDQEDQNLPSSCSKKGDSQMGGGEGGGGC